MFSCIVFFEFYCLFLGVTTNSEDCSSDLDDVSDAAPADRCSDCFVLDGDANTFLNPPSVKGR